MTKVMIKMYNLIEILPSIPKKLIIQELSDITNFHCRQEANLSNNHQAVKEKIEAYNLVTMTGKIAIVFYPAAKMYH